MLKARYLASCLAISALTAMTACSGGNQQAAVTAPPPAPAPAPAPAATPQNVELSPSLIRRVQAVLKRDGMYRGHVDGISGPMTQRGVTQFQHKNNLQATGSIDGPTLDAMNLGSAAGGGMSGGNMGSSGAMGGSSDMGSGAATMNGNNNNSDNMSGSPMSGPPSGSAGTGMGGGSGTGGGGTGGGGHS